MEEDNLENGEDLGYLPEPNAAREEMDTILTGGRGILLKPGTLANIEDYAARGQSEEIRLKRALLKMDIRSGKESESEIGRLDQKVSMIAGAKITPYFWSTKGDKPGDMTVEIDFNF